MQQPQDSRPFAASVLSRSVQDLTRPGSATISILDVLRSLAILLVFSDHGYVSFFKATGIDLPLARFPLIHFGWSGVDLFFVLSGYLIGRQLWRELRDTAHIRVGRFLLRRGLRIWPFYFLFVAIMAAVAGMRDASSFWPDLVFLSNYTPGRISGGWSLSTEEQFYLVVPLMLLVTVRIVPFRFQWVPPFALLCTLPAVRALVLALHGPAQHGDSSLVYVTYTPFHTHCDGLLAGLLLAWASVSRPAFVAPAPFWSNVRIPAVLAAVGLALRGLNADLFAFTGLALTFVGCTLFGLRDRTGLTSFARLRIFHMLSRLSYAMYLNHFVVLRYLMPTVWEITGSLNPTPRFLLGYGIALFVSVALAAVSFIVIESPFLQLRDRWMSDGGVAGTSPPVNGAGCEHSPEPEVQA